LVVPQPGTEDDDEKDKRPPIFIQAVFLNCE
jgi:hypothetical protein